MQNLYLHRPGVVTVAFCRQWHNAHIPFPGLNTCSWVKAFNQSLKAPIAKATLMSISDRKGNCFDYFLMVLNANICKAALLVAWFRFQFALCLSLRKSIIFKNNYYLQYRMFEYVHDLYQVSNAAWLTTLWDCKNMVRHVNAKRPFWSGRKARTA